MNRGMYKLGFLHFGGNLINNQKLQYIKTQQFLKKDIVQFGAAICVSVP